MKSLLTALVCVAMLGCKGRFNWYDRLTEKPTDSELVGSYRLVKADSAASPLIEMGYTDIDCRLDLNTDGSFEASRLPGCCLHGWDERTYPFTGGLYSAGGTWRVIKNDAVFDVKLTINSITEHTGLAIADKELAAERKPPTTLEVALIDGTPLDLGFNIFNGDFELIRLARHTAKNKDAEHAAPLNEP
jgi:hypothetical protein